MTTKAETKTNADQEPRIVLLGTPSSAEINIQRFLKEQADRVREAKKQAAQSLVKA